MATIYFANYKKRQLGNFLNKYPCIIVTNCLECDTKSLQSSRTKSLSTLTLELSKYITTNRCFKQFTKTIFFLKNMMKSMLEL